MPFRPADSWFYRGWTFALVIIRYIFQNISRPMQAQIMNVKAHLCRERILWWSLTGVFAAHWAFADSITLPSSADTSLYAAFPNNNLGTNSNFLVGGNGSGLPGRGLIRFDLASQIPAGAII